MSRSVHVGCCPVHVGTACIVNERGHHTLAVSLLNKPGKVSAWIEAIGEPVVVTFEGGQPVVTVKAVG